MFVEGLRTALAVGCMQAECESASSMTGQFSAHCFGMSVETDGITTDIFSRDGISFFDIPKSSAKSKPGLQCTLAKTCSEADSKQQPGDTCRAPDRPENDPGIAAALAPFKSMFNKLCMTRPFDCCTTGRKQIIVACTVLMMTHWPKVPSLRCFDGALHQLIPRDVCRIHGILHGSPLFIRQALCAKLRPVPPQPILPRLCTFPCQLLSHRLRESSHESSRAP